VNPLKDRVGLPNYPKTFRFDFLKPFTEASGLDYTPADMLSTTLSGGMDSGKPHEPDMRTQPFSADDQPCHVRFLCRLDFKRLRRLCFDILRRRFFFKLPI
jgi:hypothetical protein